MIQGDSEKDNDRVAQDRKSQPCKTAHSAAPRRIATLHSRQPQPHMVRSAILKAVEHRCHAPVADLWVQVSMPHMEF